VSQFPNIKRLQLYGCAIKAADFAFLLRNWAQLEQLAHLFEPHFPISWIAENWVAGGQFWSAVDSLKRLRHLALPHDYLTDVDSFYERILPQLHSLHIFLDYDYSYDSLSTLISHCAQSKLNNLTWTAVRHRVGSVELGNKVRWILKNQTDLFASQLTHFGLNIPLSLDLLPVIGAEFRHLTHLSLISSASLELILPVLSQLELLTSFRLCHKSHVAIDYADNEDEEESDEFNAERCPLPVSLMRSHAFFPEEIPEEIPQLHHLNTLHLVNVDFFRWSHFNYLSMATPALHSIHFESCEFHLESYPSIISKSRLLLGTLLSKFPQLKRIYRNGRLLLDLNVKEQIKGFEHSLRELFRKRRRLNSHTKLGSGGSYSYSGKQKCCCSHLKSLLMDRSTELVLAGAELMQES